jgi:hypothetical protein
MGIVTTKFDKTIYNQIGGTCYAHAIAEAIISAQILRYDETMKHLRSGVMYIPLALLKV